MYRDAAGQHVSAVGLSPAQAAELLAEPVAEADAIKLADKWVLRADNEVVLVSKSEKMSKSRGNVVNPDEVVAVYGADSLRLHLMFMGPLEAVKAWNTSSIDGVHRFLSRVWRLFDRSFKGALRQEGGAAGPTMVDPPAAQQEAVDAMVRRVTDELEGLRVRVHGPTANDSHAQSSFFDCLALRCRCHFASFRH